MGALPATYACAVPRDLTIPQTATFLGVDSNSIRAWAEVGHIRHTLTPDGPAPAGLSWPRRSSGPPVSS